MEIIENIGELALRFKVWNPNEELRDYPFVKNTHAPFTPMRRALPMANVALVSSAGAYIDGTQAFDLSASDGDLSFREIPIEVDSEDLLFSVKNYDASEVLKDRNVLIPIDRLSEYEANGVIGKLNPVWWSMSSHIPNAARVATDLAPKIAERISASGAQVAIFIPASPLCHQTLGIIAREVESRGICTMLISTNRKMTDSVRPPRVAYYEGVTGATLGRAGWKQYHLRILDEALRWTETFDQPGSRKLSVEIESITELARGEK